jgi:hypothetical protein
MSAAVTKHIRRLGFNADSGANTWLRPITSRAPTRCSPRTSGMIRMIMLTKERGNAKQVAIAQERMDKLRQSGIFHDSTKDTKRGKLRRQQQQESERNDLAIAQPDTVRSRNEVRPYCVDSVTSSSRRLKRISEQRIPAVDLTKEKETECPKCRIRKLLVPGLGSSALQTLEPVSAPKSKLRSTARATPWKSQGVSVTP